MYNKIASTIYAVISFVFVVYALLIFFHVAPPLSAQSVSVIALAAFSMVCTEISKSYPRQD